MPIAFGYILKTREPHAPSWLCHSRAQIPRETGPPPAPASFEFESEIPGTRE
jgi:hypothetical protein